MMQIVYFSDRKQFLAEMDLISGEKLFVTPSPAKADNLRSQLSSTSNQDSITIAKFTSDLLKILWTDEERPSVKRKAELLLIFGILKNKYLADLEFEQFIQSYNLFSDLRSFTLNQDALVTVLEEQPQEIRQAVGLFWQLLELTGYVDEHAAYQKIAEALRAADEQESLKKIFIFWGFQHLNGQQIDLLKALAIRYQVIIPFPLKLKEKLKRADWPSWLLDHKVEEKYLEAKEVSPKGRWRPVNSRELATSLRDHLDLPSQIVLGVSKLGPHHLEIVPHTEVSFKIPHQILDTELLEISKEVTKSFNQDFGEWLISKRKEILESKNTKQMPFKRLKALQLYEESYALIQELTDEKIAIDSFFQKLLHEVVALNQPRTSYIPLMRDPAKFELKDMSSLEDIRPASRVILCIDERFEDIQGLGQNYSESIQKSLAALGPLKRNELELSFKQWEFEDLFHRSDVLVLMSESVLKHSLIWKKLFSSIQLEITTEAKEFSRRELLDCFSLSQKLSYNGHFSASRFQSYMDCPRKFYYSFVEKISPQVRLEKDIDPLLSGTIIHKIIEDYFNRNLQYEQLTSLTKEIFDGVIRDHQLKLPLDVYLQRQLVFNHRASNGIRFLGQVVEVVGEAITWKIEDNFMFEDDFKLVGQIDCIGISEKHVFLLDFKSSKAAASSNTDVESMDSIQLWVYALAASRKIPDFEKKSIVLGYVILDDSSESNLLYTDEDSFSQMKAAKICRPKMLEENFSESLKMAQNKLLDLVNKIRADQVFPPKPRKSGVCQFCELSSVCLKSEIDNV